MFRFIHTADLHLDAPLKSLALKDEDLAELVGKPHIVMPGMPQGRDIGEAGPKSVTLVTVDNGTVAIEERPTSTVEFTRQEVALDGVDDWRDALQAIEVVIASVAMAPSDHSVLRLELTGETSLA